MDKVKVIAELANAHDGKFEKLLHMIFCSKAADVDFVKFQLFRAKKLVTKNHPMYSGYLKKEFSEKEWIDISKYCRSIDLKFFVDIFDDESLKIGDKMKPYGYKVHSTNLSNPFLLRNIAEKKKPILLGISGCTDAEIELAINIIREKTNTEIVLMNGHQNFPTALNETNLKRISTLKNRFKLPVGLQDHIDGYSDMAQIVPLLGVAMGYSYIEKHFTIDRDTDTISKDYLSSLNREELIKMVKRIKQIPVVLGDTTLKFTNGELKYRESMKKSIVAKRDIKAGEKITLNNIEFKRGKSLGLQPDSIHKIIDKKATKLIKEDEVICQDMIV